VSCFKVLGQWLPALPKRTESKAMVAGFALAWFAVATGANAQSPEAGKILRDCDTCPEMVVIPAGSFEMRTPPWGPGYPHNEGYFFPVTFEAPFAIGKYEITFAEWDVCVSEGRCEALDDADWGRGRRPAMNLSWAEAVIFTKWLSARTGHTYRLPTNAEWEYAARAGLGMNRFFDIPATEVCKFGNVYDETGHREFEFEWRPMPCDDGEAVTAPVGQFSPNAFGLHDAIGNVFEWTEDCASPNWRGAPGNGAPWVEGDCSLRGYRGASWITNEPYYLVESTRFKFYGARENDLGFRVVREIN
jgi:formylglycine-generating enzyme required for sulfatase activity